MGISQDATHTHILYHISPHSAHIAADSDKEILFQLISKIINIVYQCHEINWPISRTEQRIHTNITKCDTVGGEIKTDTR